MSPHTTGEMLPKPFAALWIHRENGIRAITKKKSWEGVSIKVLQNSTIGNRRLSSGIGNKTTVPQGVVWTSSQGLKIRRANERRSVQLTQMSAECYGDSMACCSVVLRLRTGRKLVKELTFPCAYV